MTSYSRIADLSECFAEHPKLRTRPDILIDVKRFAAWGMVDMELPEFEADDDIPNIDVI